eukprot:TRINITY_DN27449_c0_g1_i1.p1 TRINITY_DN27449_c0_g1~~TRINITY_DN27449_c0_g1_i1.p1  ORF type:complete len:155 (-),score=9.48 TRINITY_DN27449_c0_g1_i1:223-657(-)
MATKVSESIVIPVPRDVAWEAVGSLKFNWWTLVAKADLQPTGPFTGIVTVNFKDSTVQRFRITEFSQERKFITFELLESTPPSPCLSTVHTIRVRSVTASNEAFVEWVTDHSADATQAVLQDSHHKRLEALADLARALAGKTTA